MSFNPTPIAISSQLQGYGKIQQTGTASITVPAQVLNSGNSLSYTTTLNVGQTDPNLMWDLVGYNPTAGGGTYPNVIFSIMNTTVNYAPFVFLWVQGTGIGGVSNEQTQFTSTWNNSTNSFVITLQISNNDFFNVQLVGQTVFFTAFYYPAPF